MDRLNNHRLLNDYNPCSNLIQKIIHEYVTKLGLPSFLHITSHVLLHGGIFADLTLNILRITDLVLHNGLWTALKGRNENSAVARGSKILTSNIGRGKRGTEAA